MDSIGLQTLREEMLEDSRVLLDAFDKATERFARKDVIAYEACAHQLCSFYNAFEQMSLRVAKAFENHIDNEHGWHSSLLNRVSLAIAGVRPALISHDLKLPLNELRGFRHVFVHAYDLEIDPEKLALLLKYAAQVTTRFPALVDEFTTAVGKQVS